MSLRYSVLTLFALLCAVPTASAQNTILAELFRNINCGNCRPADDAFESFLAANPQYKVEKVYYHNEITNPNDPFYLASKASVAVREGANFYAVASDPSAYVDGVSATSSEGTWESYIKAAATAGSLPAQVTVSSDYVGGKYNIKYTINSSTATSAKVYVLMVESGIIFDNPDLYGKLDVWNNVFRETLPKETGSASFTLPGTVSDSVMFDPSTQPTWNPQKMRAIVVVQTLGSGANPHAVVGFSGFDLAASSSVASTIAIAKATVSVLGNPVTSNSAVRVMLPQAANVRVVVNDMLGREVAKMCDGTLGAGEYSLPLSNVHVAGGTYFVNMFVDGVATSSCKIVAE